jgi:hypothetical protein
MADKTIFHTTLYSDKAYALIEAFIYNMNDGFKCGSRASGKLYNSTLKRTDDGEVVFEVTQYDGYRSYNRTIWRKCKHDPAKVRDELAWLLKCMVRNYAGPAHWNRNDVTDISACFTRFTSYNESRKIEVRELMKDVTVQDIYCVYELMRARKNLEQKYSAEMIEKWRGAQFDPVRTELEKAKREQLAEFEKLEQEANQLASKKCDKDINDYGMQRRKQRDEEIKLIKEDFYKKRVALIEQCRNALAFALA